jgi:hypothetical protein
MEYLFTERHIKWRINWYNEIKLPMLTAPIISDNGKYHLDEKIKALHDVIKGN